MTEAQKSDITKGLIGGAALVGIPTAVGLVASSNSTMSIEDLGKLVTVVGILPTVVLLGFLALLAQSKRVSEQAIAQANRVSDESRAREERMATHIDEIEKWCRTELAALVRQNNASLDKNTQAILDLHETQMNHQQQMVLLLTRNTRDGSVTMMTPLTTPGEVASAAEAMKARANG